MVPVGEAEVVAGAPAVPAAPPDAADAVEAPLSMRFLTLLPPLLALDVLLAGTPADPLEPLDAAEPARVRGFFAPLLPREGLDAFGASAASPAADSGFVASSLAGDEAAMALTLIGPVASSVLALVLALALAAGVAALAFAGGAFFTFESPEVRPEAGRPPLLG